MKTFTDKQLANFRAYVRVQRSNRYNMFDPRAARAAGLTHDEMGFCMENYEALAEATGEEA